MQFQSEHYLCIYFVFYKQENAESVERNHFYAALLSPVGNVEASQVVGSITEEV